MAILYITEYAELALDAQGRSVPVGKEPAIAQQTVTFTGGATQSAAFNGKTRFIRCYSDTAGYMLFGIDPTATTAQDTPIAATTAEYFGITPGQKLSIVQ
jgi:hypothetical protein